MEAGVKVERGRPTCFEVDKILNQILHQAILRHHVPLKAHHLSHDRLIIPT